MSTVPVPRPEVSDVLLRFCCKRRLNIGDLPPIERGLCRWCGARIENKRKTWCSNACSREFSVRWSSSRAMHYLMRLKDGRCEDCGRVVKNVRDRVTAQMIAEADHVIPVVLGGGCCGLEGFRLLCHDCHAERTAALKRHFARPMDSEAVYP